MDLLLQEIKSLEQEKQDITKCINEANQALKDRALHKRPGISKVYYEKYLTTANAMLFGVQLRLTELQQKYDSALRQIPLKYI